MSIELKIKAKHLALEPAIIRKEEQKLLKQIRWMKEHQQPTEKLEYKRISLYNHRTYDVRNEARATHLARAYIAGKSYNSVERSCKEYTTLFRLVDRIASMVAKYGETPIWIKDEKKMKELKHQILDWIGKD